MKRFLAITGATTSGKTEVSLRVAERLGGEIVSMDSRQIYRGLDIGTDKAGPEARARVPHHGLDIRDPGGRYSAGDFARDARRWIADIEARGRVPLLVGGTGFFLRAVIDPIFSEPPMEAERRERLGAYLYALEDRAPGSLAAWARRLDPARAALAEQGGRQRLARTLEVALLSGRPLSWWHRNAPAEAPAVDGLVIVIEVPREELDRRIDARVDRMVEQGLLDEIRGLHEAGVRADWPGLSGQGYRELLAWAGGALPLEAALDEMKRQTRRYARRQLTWLRNQLPHDAVRIDGLAPLEERVEHIVRAWEAVRGVGTSTNEEDTA
ncbi:MAG: tRNA (adenosine(37)-N6)-dimethylallyltransferase MiaA [Gemmatimonadetes bacterium]|nr:MAG: tRNA (adenosine(37)-N6)-dimethylallyltransferase MiaA [Gemmatimonadota bacterium]